MTFGEAMELVAEGKRVTKAEWGNTGIFLELKDGYLKIVKGDKPGDVLLVSEGDLIGKDWMEI